MVNRESLCLKTLSNKKSDSRMLESENKLFEKPARKKTSACHCQSGDRWETPNVVCRFTVGAVTNTLSASSTLGCGVAEGAKRISSCRYSVGQVPGAVLPKNSNKKAYQTVANIPNSKLNPDKEMFQSGARSRG